MPVVIEPDKKNRISNADFFYLINCKLDTVYVQIAGSYNKGNKDAVLMSLCHT